MYKLLNISKIRQTFHTNRIKLVINLSLWWLFSNSSSNYKLGKISLQSLNCYIIFEKLSVEILEESGVGKNP